jgi:hypothetical protein
MACRQQYEAKSRAFGPVVAFDDLSSLGHVALGAIAGRSSLLVAWSIFGLFAVYQAVQVEPVQHKRGDFLELLAGFLGARV